MGLIARKRRIRLREKSYVSGKLSLIRIHINDYSQNLVYISNGYAYQFCFPTVPFIRSPRPQPLPAVSVSFLFHNQVFFISCNKTLKACNCLYSTLLAYFLLFFSCVYTGCYSDPVACDAPKFWVSRPGGRAINPAPPPAHVFISRFLLCLLCLLCLDYC
jgi:hypothetical protein